MEVLVVIDGPDPATEEALSAIRDPRLRVVVNAENQGQAETRNIGARHARGEWIAFLDDDDQWLPEKVERQLQVALSLNCTHALIVSRFIERTAKLDRIIPEALPKSTKRFSEYLYCERGFLQPSSLLVSRQLLLDVPFTRGSKLDDTEWLLHVAADPRTRLGVVEEALSIYNNLSLGNRVTYSGPWETLYVWGIANRSLFTPKAFSLFMTKQCVSRARQNGASAKVLFHLLISGCVLGSFNPEAIFYFFLYVFFSGDTRRALRGGVGVPFTRRLQMGAE
jgi:glycosyltransferase involved in cell wall biosynthesis